MFRIGRAECGKASVHRKVGNDNSRYRLDSRRDCNFGKAKRREANRDMYRDGLRQNHGPK